MDQRSIKLTNSTPISIQFNLEKPNSIAGLIGKLQRGTLFTMLINLE
jgi:hypothetical protein